MPPLRPLLYHLTESLALPPVPLHLLLLQLLDLHYPLDYVLLAFSPAALPVIQILKNNQSFEVIWWISEIEPAASLQPLL